MTPVERVLEIAHEAANRLDASFSAPDVLPFAEAAISVIEANPNLQPEFETAFLGMTAIAPPEFIEVCMHALRWPNLRKEFEARYRAAVDRNDWRAEPVYRHYLEAFESEWEDAKDLYVTYFSRKEP